MRGLVFTCREGELDLAHPAALLAAIVSWDPPPGIATLPCPDTDVAVIIGHTLNTLSAESLDHAGAEGRAVDDVLVGEHLGGGEDPSSWDQNGGGDDFGNDNDDFGSFGGNDGGDGGGDSGWGWDDDGGGGGGGGDGEGGAAGGLFDLLKDIFHQD